VVQDLKTTYFPQAAQQLAVDETNDFIFGPLHEVLRQRLAAGIGNGEVTDAIPLDELDLHLKIDPSTPPPFAACTSSRRRLRSRARRPGPASFRSTSSAPCLSSFAAREKRSSRLSGCSMTGPSWATIRRVR
jgi:hypothetical protein